LSDYRHPSYGLRVGLGIDDLGQSIMGRGIPNLSISARAGTARYDYYNGSRESHHLWGVALFWLLDKAVIRFSFRGKRYSIGFGPDPDTGEPHCDGAIHGDRWRSFDLIVALWKYYPDAALAAAMRALLDGNKP
jgi:hypothetical protein